MDSFDKFDPDRIEITVGKEKIYVPVLSWWLIKHKVNPYLRNQQEVRMGDDGNQRPMTADELKDTAIDILSIALTDERPELDPEKIARRLSWAESEYLVINWLPEFLDKSGFQTQGQVPPMAPPEVAGEEKPNGISTSSSLNALPEGSSGVIGTA